MKDDDVGSLTGSWKETQSCEIFEAGFARKRRYAVRAMREEKRAFNLSRFICLIQICN